LWRQLSSSPRLARDNDDDDDNDNDDNNDDNRTNGIGLQKENIMCLFYRPLVHTLV